MLLRKKKPWAKPTLRTFRSPEELAEYVARRSSGPAPSGQIEELIARWREEKSLPRR